MGLKRRELKERIGELAKLVDLKDALKKQSAIIREE